MTSLETDEMQVQKVLLKKLVKESLLKKLNEAPGFVWLQPHANANPTEGEHFYDDASRNKTRSHKGGGT